MKTDKLNMAGLIDHSLLQPEATEADVVKLCEEAKRYGFFSVCVYPSYIKMAKEFLSGSKVRISTVIGFPSGMTSSGAKIYEALEAVILGADELDIVMNIGTAKSGRWNTVEQEITDILTATPGSVHKIIIETCYLTEDEKKKATSMVTETGAEFVKTSTGFGTAGATVQDVKLIKSITKGKTGIKAAGGIKTVKDIRAFIEAGATRIGTSAGVEIMKEG